MGSIHEGAGPILVRGLTPLARRPAIVATRQPPRKWQLLVPRGGHFDFSIFDGGATFASKIAANYSEFNNPTLAGAYIAAGLVLFVLTFVVNFAARAIIGDKKGD